MSNLCFVAGNVGDVLPEIPAASIDVVVTSPPYNLGADYGNGCTDDRAPGDYLSWLNGVFRELERVLKPDGALFLNVGWSSSYPWLSQDVAAEAVAYLMLQNRIVWVKALALGDEPVRGHVKPVNSARFLNRQWEEIYHFTKTGEVKIDRLAVGVPYADTSNLDRGTRGKNGNVRCRGDVWVIPHETTGSKADNWHHPCPFPVELVRRCVKLHGLREGLVLLDPFCGVGTVGVAARELGCRAILVDQSPEYIRAARTRCGLADCEGDQ